MTSNMDRITIAASAAICGTVLIAVVVFIAASKSRAKKLRTLHNAVASGHPNKSGIPVGTLPANCYAGPNAAQMSSLAALNAFNSHKDWDQGSVYSNRSLNPSRMYRMADSRQGLNEDLHSNISNFSAKPPKMRSVADGQSQNSFSNNSMRYLGGNNAYATDLVNSRPELRQSRQSLAVSERMSHISYPGSGRTNTSRNKPRQRSRTRDGTQNRPPSRYSHTGSHHTLNNYCGGDTSDNWTDHDMDIYMTRNPTARNGLVPL
ncbi:PREDICTED: uncharacterized protein LOC107164360 [Diuraphis noxia]|uniref:uncharacterized protein LOC107164360 n=1 Tax=Diuraphis noxia TaxID=143948 RepID=UPI0007635CBD|nr:PREDICTED: uncharacterized protein LOC107164360 [Diuraphis noxia]